MANGILVLLLVVVAVVRGAGVYAQDDEEYCCHGDHAYDLDPGLGLLAEQRMVVTVRKSALSLHCDVAAEPQFGNLTFVWKTGGQKIQSRSPKGRRYTYPNGTLHIRKVVHRTKAGVRISDEGMYECYVSNSVGTVIAQRIQLVIASLGKNFSVQPAGGTIRVGENFFLPCQINATPQDLMVVWQKDATVLETDDHPRYVITRDGLLILRAQVNDSGAYQCQVTNENFFTFVHDNTPSPLQWRNSQPAKLVVSPRWCLSKPFVLHHISWALHRRGSPDRCLKAHARSLCAGEVLKCVTAKASEDSFLLTPDNVTDVLVGDSVDLQCVSSIYDSDAVTWTGAVTSEPGTELPFETSPNFTVLPSGSLRIHEATRRLAGTYICTHSSGARAVTTLRVLEKPVIQDSSPSRVYPLASIVRLDCVVAGQPKPTIRWLKNGEEVTTIRFRVEFLQDALIIYQGKVEDSGYYQCLVENKAGWALGLTRVSVRVEPDAPPPPYNVTGKAVSSSRVMVQWKMDQPSSSLLSFTIHHRVADEEGGEEAEIVDNRSRRAVLYGLSPDTLYAITIRAYNKGGASPSSEPVLVRTDLTAFPSPSLTYVSNSTIFVNWSDFHQRHRRKDDIVSYQVYYGLSNDKHVDKMVLDTSQDSLLLTDLEENREYRVRMKATFKGDNTGVRDKNWPWSYIRTGNASLPSVRTHLAAPYNLHAVPLQPDAISLSWAYSTDSLEASLPVTHYTVRCQMLESLVMGSSCQEVVPQSVILKTSHSNMATLDNLKAFTVYNISVSAHSDNLQGPYSRPILVQTKEDVPSRPENLEAEVVSQGQVRLQWQPPTSPNGLIQGHFILYVNQQSTLTSSTNNLVNMTWIQLYQSGNTTRATVSNLTQRVYIFQVLACTNAGKGAPSTLVFVNMGDSTSKSGLTDQHLGILGGSVIGLTSIIITVIVIVCKQKQLQKQLENRYKLEQDRQLSSRPADLQSPASVTSQLTPSTARSEELEQLLTHPPPGYIATTYPNALYPAPSSNASADSDSRDSGCSSSAPQPEDDVGSETVYIVGENTVWNEASTKKESSEDGDLSAKHSAKDSVEQRETTC